MVSIPAPDPERDVMFDWTGARWAIDTHVPDHPNGYLLRGLAAHGWISLEALSPTLAEIDQMEEGRERDRVVEEVFQFPVSMAPMVLDHALLDFSLTSTPEDRDRLERVYSLMWPDHDPALDAASSTAKGRTRYRDAYLVATAIRNAFNVYVTCDVGVLRARRAIHDEYPSLQVACIAEATTMALQDVAEVFELLKADSPYYKGHPTPAWPTEAQLLGLPQEEHDVASACPRCPFFAATP